MTKRHASPRNSPASPSVLNAEVRVRVTPRGGRDAVMGVRASDGILLVRVAAPPIDGAANRACLTLLAEVLAVKKMQVDLIGGETSRDKRFRISGLSPEQGEARLALLPRCSDEPS